MNARTLGLCFLMVSRWWAVASAQTTPPKEATPAAASSTKEEQEVLALSKDKWQWMSERNVDALTALFHDKAVFVHMGGTMSKSQELDVIRSGRIQYKQAEILEASVQQIGTVQEGGTRKLASLSFTRLLTP